MPVVTRPALRLLAGPCLLALTVAACSSSSAKSPAAQGGTSSPTPAASAAPTGSATAAPSAAASSPASASASSSAAGRSTASPAAKPGATTGSTTAPRTSVGTAPGSYTYDTTGTVTAFGGTQDASGATSFTVSALSGGSQRTEMKNAHSTTDEQLIPRTSGTFVSDLTISTQLFTVEFKPAPAALLFPAGAKTGQSWSWSATSTDGKTTATQSSKVTGTQTMVVGGQRVSTVVVQTHLVMTGQVTYTVDITNWVAPAYRMVVKDHQVGQGKQGAFTYSNDLTDVLRSLRPA